MMKCCIFSKRSGLLQRGFRLVDFSFSCRFVSLNSFFAFSGIVCSSTWNIIMAHFRRHYISVWSLVHNSKCNNESVRFIESLKVKVDVENMARLEKNIPNS